MSNQRLKSENYAQFGGINQKASPYVLGPIEWLDLANLDFQTPGSLSMRWGSTMYTGQTFSGQINTLFEYTKLNGSSMILIGHTGGLWFGATSGQHQGMSFSLSGTTSVYSVYGGYIGYSGSGGFQHPFPDSNGFYVQNAVNRFGVNAANTGGQTFIVAPFLQKDNTESCVTLNDYLISADGNKFFKFNGTTTFRVGLPYVAVNAGLTAISNPKSVGMSIFGTSAGASMAIPMGQGGATGGIFFYLTYVNNRGYEGPLTPIIGIKQEQAGANSPLEGGGTHLAAGANIATPLDFGISAINQYYYFYSGLFGNNEKISPFDYTPFYLNTTSASGSTLTWVQFGTSDTSNVSLLVNNGSAYANLYDALGTPVGMTLTFGASKYIAVSDFYPRYLETYQNRLVAAGFSQSPSDVWFSDTGEFEGFNPEWNFEVRTDDGDIVTAVKAYSTRCYIFKKFSFHVLTGDSPNNFVLTEISSEYGCLNHKCVVVFDDILLFLDQKGLVQYNGANIEMLSTKYQPIFDRMNYPVALNTARMVHDKLRNQILIGIPIDGSSTNNITVVFDYLSKAWTSYKGFSPSVFATIQGRNTTKNAFYGDTQGRVNWFGPSFLADNGTGFTTYAKSRFLHDMGESTQKMFRRMFLNIDAPGSTMVMNINLYQDYGSSIVLGTTMVLGGFQNRIDFGVSAKSLAFEMASIQTSNVLKLHGFTVESRFLRKE